MSETTVRPRIAWLATLFVLPALLLGSSPAAADAPRAGRAEAAPGEVLVRYREGVSEAIRRRVREAAGARAARPLRAAPGIELLAVDPRVPPAEAAAALARRPEVLFAEPNALRRIAERFPNDPLFGQQWGLHNTGQGGTADADVDAPEAWDVTTGSTAVTVAVLDTGVDLSHPDLSASIWTNPGETGGGKESNGLDDDGNGYVDDWRGWDFVDDDNNPIDENGHGTHVAGIVGARGNDGFGVTGVAWTVKIMPLRVLDASGEGSVSDGIEAYAYAARNGARILNASFVGPLRSNTEAQAISGTPGVLFSVAAGNTSTDNDLIPQYPCNYGAELSLGNLVCVAATDGNDQLASFSNYGSRSVHLAAPGVGILSTVPGGHGYANGTSMASPHVAGAAALVAATGPGLSASALRDAVLAGVDAKPSLAGRTATGGRLNAALAVGAPEPQPPGTPAITSPANDAVLGSRSVTVAGTAEPAGTVEVSEATTVLGRATADPTGIWSIGLTLADGLHELVATAIDDAGRARASSEARRFTVDTVAPSEAKVTGSAFSARFQTRTGLPIGWMASDAGSGVATYDVRYRRAPSGGRFRAFVAYRTDTTTTGASFPAAAGYTYCFVARGTDRAGNDSAWSAQRCTAFPVDDPSLSATGSWVRSSGAYYLGTYSYTTRRGSTLRRSVLAKRLALVVTRCPGCGTVEVYLGSVLLRRVSLNATTTARTQVVPVKNFTSARSGTVTVKVVSSGRRVIVEGLGVSLV